MRLLIAITTLMLFLPSASIGAQEDRPHQYATPATSPPVTAGLSQPASLQEPLRDDSQRRAGDGKFPSPNQARRETPAQMVSTSTTEPVAAEETPTDNASAEPSPLQLQRPEGRTGLNFAGPGSEDTTRDSLPSPLSSIITVGGSLAVVLGLFFTMAWLMRRSMPKGNSRLPEGIVEVLGRTNLGGKQPVQLVRCGNKLVLLATSQSGMTPLTEITDPMEVDRLAGLCQQSQPFSATQAFGQVLQQHGHEHPTAESNQVTLARLASMAGLKQS